MADVNIKINLITGQAQKELSKLSASLKRINSQLGNKDGIAGSGTKKKLSNFSRSFGRISDIAKGFISANLFFAIGNQIKQAFTTAIKNVADFEDALVGVARTTNLTAKEFKELSDGIEKLATELPTTRVELANIAKIAGQLGVRGVRNLLKFSKTISRLTLSTDLTAESAALALTRILNLTQEPIEDIDRLSSAIVEVGNNFAATESEIVTLASELGRATAGFNVTSAELIGIAGALKSLGARAEGAGTAIGRLFREIESSITESGPQLVNFALIAGESAEEFKRSFENDALGAIVKFLKGANQLDKAGTKIGTTLNLVGLNTDRLNKVLRPVIDRIGLLEDGLDQAKRAAEENVAAINESEKALNTLSSQYSILQNRVIEATSNALEPFTDALKEIIKVSNVESRISELIEINPQTAAESRQLIKDLTKELSIFESTGAGAGPTAFKDFAKQRLALQIELNKKLEDIEKTQEQQGIQNALRRSLLTQVEIKAEAKVLKEAFDKKSAETLAAAEAENISLQEQRAKSRVLLAEEELTQAGLDKQRRELALLIIAENEQTKLDLIRTARAEDITDKIKQTTAIEKIENDAARRKLQLDKDVAKTSIAIQEVEAKAKIVNIRGFAGLAGAIAKDGSKEQFAISKAAALAEAIVQRGAALAAAAVRDITIGAIPGAGPFSAAATLQSNLSIATIVASAIKGFQDGGVVGGTSNSGDRVLARVNSGEMILNRQQQSSLFNQINQGGSTNNDVPLQNNISIEIDGEAITKVVSRSVANGSVLGEVGV